MTAVFAKNLQIFGCQCRSP